MGGACAELHHSDRNLREQPDLRERILKEGLKKHWVDFYHYRMDVYTHIYVQITFKVNFASDDPFKGPL